MSRGGPVSSHPRDPPVPSSVLFWTPLSRYRDPSDLSSSLHRAVQGDARAGACLVPGRIARWRGAAAAARAAVPPTAERDKQRAPVWRAPTGQSASGSVRLWESSYRSVRLWVSGPGFEQPESKFPGPILVRFPVGHTSSIDLTSLFFPPPTHAALDSPPRRQQQRRAPGRSVGVGGAPGRSVA